MNAKVIVEIVCQLYAVYAMCMMCSGSGDQPLVCFIFRSCAISMYRIKTRPEKISDSAQAGFVVCTYCLPPPYGTDTFRKPSRG